MTPAGRRGARGQALVEFALIVPVLLLLVLGIVEFGRAWNAHQVLTDAAREAARTAVVRRALGRAALDPEQANITITGWRTGRGTPATVAISYSHTLGWLSALLEWSGADATAVLRTSFSMRNE
jgi:Flp pilus assembly protein TadG